MRVKRKREEISDEKLVRAALAGDQGAFSLLYYRTLPTIKGVISKYCNTRYGVADDVEDFVQMSFLVIFSKLPTWKGKSTFKTWAYRIATNCFLQEYRRSSEKLRRYSVSVDSPIVNEDGTFILWEPVSENQHIAWIGDTDKLHHAISLLAPCYQKAINCRLRELTYEESANELGMSVPCVKAYMTRGVKQLKRHFSQ